MKRKLIIVYVYVCIHIKNLLKILLNLIIKIN
jgi:hypothetical protein